MSDMEIEGAIVARDGLMDVYGEPRSSFPVAVAAGIASAVIGAVLWAVAVFATHMALGLFAIAVGALVGLSVRRAGNGDEPKFAVLGAACAALGWALGTILCDIAFLAQNVDQPFFEVATRLSPGQIASLAIAASDPMDIVFLGIAMYEGYRFSLRKE